MKKNIKLKGYDMISWAKKLFPICRSITGAGLRETIHFLKDINPNIKILTFNSGKKIFDWKIPDEWNIKNSYIEDESGKKYAEFSKSNLHVVNYSVPINKWISKNELLKHIYTVKNFPDAIPYVTSYYKKKMGILFIRK